MARVEIPHGDVTSTQLAAAPRKSPIARPVMCRQGAIHLLGPLQRVAARHRDRGIVLGDGGEWK
jgi:hypothetical protein